MHRFLKRAAVLGVVALLLTACGAQAQRTPAAAIPERPFPAVSEVPSLVVVLTVDQLRGDYLDRFRRLDGGIARLARDGAWFTNAHHDHAITETAPGHSVILAGRHPRSTGIVRNNAGIQDPAHPLLEADGQPASPMRFQGGTLVDWLTAKNPETRVLSVSRKDRSAILPVGRSRQEVYWYAEQGGIFTTSTYYRDSLPTWVQRFNRERGIRRFAGQSWEPLHPGSTYPEPESVQGGDLNLGRFPYRLPDDTAQLAVTIASTPFMDQMTLELALTGLRELRLGEGPHTDVLSVALSATDHVGHRWGPDSRELHDQILRLDHMLGAFLDTLFMLRDSSRVAIVLTGDHGVAPYPEVHFQWPVGGTGRGRVEVRDIFQRFESELRARGVDSLSIGFDGGMVLVDRPAFDRVQVNVDSVLHLMAGELRRREGVQRVDLVRDLVRADTSRDVIARRWLNVIPDDLPVAMVYTLEPYWYPAWITYATHGTPHPYDSHVPIVFHGPQFRPGRYDAFVRTVDIASTLAWVTATQPADRLDGRVLWQALR